MLKIFVIVFGKRIGDFDLWKVLGLFRFCFCIPLVFSPRVFA